MPQLYRFHQIDVFSDTALLGNPVAVVHGADSLNDTQMAAFARWTNLSETTFLLAPTVADADYRLRIFTPGGELPFAGHPTLGSCRAWLLAGHQPRVGQTVVQQCGIGLVPIRQEGRRLGFAAPPLLKSGPLDRSTLQRALAACGLTEQEVLAHHWVVNGPEWAAIMLDSAERVRRLRPDMAALGDLKLGVIGPEHQKMADYHYEVRAFAPGIGVPEDPVTGSLNAGIARWLIRSGIADNRYVVAQGSALHRRGRVWVEQTDGTIWISGDTVACIDGQVCL